MRNSGAVLCTCGREIASYIDVGRVVETLREEVSVTVVARLCAAEGKAQFRAFVRDNHIGAIAVAGCPARFLSRTLEELGHAVGLSAPRLTVVDWREGCAWPHAGQPHDATTKAIDLVRMGLARVEGAGVRAARAEPIVPRVLVIGGGIAGMTASRELTAQGIQVTLVERADWPGSQSHDVPLDGNGPAYEELARSLTDNPLIELRVATRVSTAQSRGGNFQVTLADREGLETQVRAGAVIIATGATEMRRPGYRYDGRRVLTVRDLNAQLASGGAIPHRLIYVLCAASRDTQIPYCSRVCCLSALQQALEIKQANPETEITVLYRDLYLPGPTAEETARLAQRAGVEFVHYQPADLRIGEEWVSAGDDRTGTVWNGRYDRVVLATPRVPDPEAGHLARMFGLARDRNGFLPDPNWRVNARAIARRAPEQNVFVCGAAHGPVEFDTAVMQGMVAAQRAARLMRQGTRQAPVWSAFTKRELCTGCAQCVQSCPTGAVELTCEPPAGIRAEIDPFRCSACGNCLATCPSKAIEMPQWSDRQLLAQIDAALTPDEDAGPHSLVFACRWSGFAAMELAGARRMLYPAGVRVIELPCSARLDARHVLYAFLNGAEWVTLALCPPGECHLGNGNAQAEERIQALRTQLAQWGFEPQRVRLARVKGDDATGWVRLATTREFGEGGWFDHTTG